MTDHVDTNNVRGLRATFATSGQMQDAVSRLSVSGFDRADLSVPSQPAGTEGASLATGSQPASTQEDAQQMRTLGASTAASVAAMAAAGVTIATGGAAAPAVAAAILAGGAAGGGMLAAQGAANQAEQHSRDERAQHGTLVLTVRAPSAAKQAEAEALLHAAGAQSVEPIAD